MEISLEALFTFILTQILTEGISLEALFTFILTPILTATGTLFTLYARTQAARLKDRDEIISEQRERIKRYDNEILPALASNDRALRDLSDLYQRMQAQHEWEIQMLRKSSGGQGPGQGQGQGYEDRGLG